MNITIPNNIELTPTNIAVIAAVVGAFILISVLAHMSRMFLSWSFSGAGIGFLAGMFAIVAIGVGVYMASKDSLKPKLTFQNEKAPATLKTLVGQKDEETAVLGAKIEISSKTVSSDFDNLSSEEKEEVKNHICSPISENQESSQE